MSRQQQFVMQTISAPPQHPPRKSKDSNYQSMPPKPQSRAPEPIVDLSRLMVPDRSQNVSERLPSLDDELSSMPSLLVKSSDSNLASSAITSSTSSVSSSRRAQHRSNSSMHLSQISIASAIPSSSATNEARLIDPFAFHEGLESSNTNSSISSASSAKPRRRAAKSTSAAPPSQAPHQTFLSASQPSQSQSQSQSMHSQSSVLSSVSSASSQMDHSFSTVAPSSITSSARHQNRRLLSDLDSSLDDSGLNLSVSQSPAATVILFPSDAAGSTNSAFATASSSRSSSISATASSTSSSSSSSSAAQFQFHPLPLPTASTGSGVDPPVDLVSPTASHSAHSLLRTGAFNFPHSSASLVSSSPFLSSSSSSLSSSYVSSSSAAAASSSPSSLPSPLVAPCLDLSSSSSHASSFSSSACRDPYQSVSRPSHHIQVPNTAFSAFTLSSSPMMPVAAAASFLAASNASHQQASLKSSASSSASKIPRHSEPGLSSSSSSSSTSSLSSLRRSSRLSSRTNSNPTCADEIEQNKENLSDLFSNSSSSSSSMSEFHLHNTHIMAHVPSAPENGDDADENEIADVDNDEEFVYKQHLLFGAKAAVSTSSSSSASSSSSSSQLDSESASSNRKRGRRSRTESALSESMLLSANEASTTDMPPQHGLMSIGAEQNGIVKSVSSSDNRAFGTELMVHPSDFTALDDDPETTQPSVFQPSENLLIEGIADFDEDDLNIAELNTSHSERVLDSAQSSSSSSISKSLDPVLIDNYFDQQQLLEQQQKQLLSDADLDSLLSSSASSLKFNALSFNSSQRKQMLELEVLTNLKRIENKYPVRLDYITNVQTDINFAMRAILCDWLVEVSEEYQLSQATYFICVNLVDRYLSVQPVKRERLQLLGVAAMMIAAKYEEIFPPTVDDFVYIADNTYTRVEVLDMERLVLKTLKFTLTSVNPSNFIDQLVEIAVASNPTLSESTRAHSHAVEALEGQIAVVKQREESRRVQHVQQVQVLEEKMASLKAAIEQREQMQRRCDRHMVEAIRLIQQQMDECHRGYAELGVEIHRLTDDWKLQTAMDQLKWRELQSHLQLIPPPISRKLASLAKYICELCMIEPVYFKYSMSMYCSAALVVAMHALGMRACPNLLASSASASTSAIADVWPPSLEAAIGYSSSELLTCAQELLRVYRANSVKVIKAVFEKYASDKHHCVTLLPVPADFH